MQNISTTHGDNPNIEGDAFVFDLEFRLTLEDAQGDIEKLSQFLQTATKSSYLVFAKNYMTAAGMLGRNVSEKQMIDIDQVFPVALYMIAKGGWNVLVDLLAHPEKFPSPLPMVPSDFVFPALLYVTFTERFLENLDTYF